MQIGKKGDGHKSNSEKRRHSMKIRSGANRNRLSTNKTGAVGGGGWEKSIRTFVTSNGWTIQIKLRLIQRHFYGHHISLCTNVFTLCVFFFCSYSSSTFGMVGLILFFCFCISRRILYNSWFLVGTVICLVSEW